VRLAGRDLARETHVYKTVGDCAIKLDVYPVARPGPAPVLVWIHGGALISGTRTALLPTLSEMCTRLGVVQVSIDYRLAPETDLPAIVEDVVDAFAWIRREGAAPFKLDPGRVAVAGHSAGGYLTLVAGQRVHPRPVALAALSGYGDILGDWYARPDPFYCTQKRVSRAEALAVVGGEVLSEVPATDHRRRAFYLYCRQTGRWPNEVAGLDRGFDRATLRTYCPEANVTPDYPRTLLIHGTHDTDVPFQQSVDMAAALERANVPHRLVTIAGGDHMTLPEVTAADLAVDPPGSAASAMSELIDFLSHHLLG
jgi:acetyl esterase/lipase